MNINKKSCITYLLYTLTLFFGCTSTKPFYDRSQRNWQSSNPPDSLKIKYSVYLIGDAGDPDEKKQEPTLKLFQKRIFNQDSLPLLDSSLNNSKPEDVVVFLGDNIYESGLPEPDASNRKERERRIIEQMKIVKNFKGKTIFIPGNHDWNEMQPGGLAAVNREEAFIESYLDSNDVFLPSNGCPGPVEIQLNNDLVIIVLDTEWWLHKHQKPIAPDNGCTAGSRFEIIQQIKDILLRNKGKNIVLAQHHPLFSNGTHGGHFSLTDYIFPLTLVRDNAWIPLPVIGSIYPLMRQYGISRQDISNKDYQQLKGGLLSVLEDEKNIVIAAGHEHALQLNKYKNINHIISGSGSKRSSLIKGNGALFTHGEKGFAKLNYYDNGQCWIEFWEPEGDGEQGKLIFRSPLYAIPAKGKTEIKEEENLNYSDSAKVISAGDEYEAGRLKRKLFGEHYRDSWAAKVKVKYLDLTTYGGGLTPVKLGGGKQTTSLQLEGKDGNLYQFRTINKDPAALLPKGFQKTFAEDFFQDQISSAHPFGSLIIPTLAKAINIYHTNPQLVYMPYSRSLGPYLQDLGGRLGTIEARPDEDVSDFKSFGNAKNAISTRKLYEELREDNDNEVDQFMFLKARLLDILISDWDRHEDQWRWAEFKKEKGSLYRPIARDRDQAFVKFDGIIPGLARKIIPDFQSFEYNLKSVAALSKAARNLDRNFLNELTKQDWEKALKQITITLSDSVFTQAINNLPVEVKNISGEEIVNKLKSRRAQLTNASLKYYSILSNEVTIAGSDKRELIKVKNFKDSTQITLYKIKNNKVEDTLYNRTFLPKETAIVNIYALNGKDSIIIEGEKNLIKLRIIGGEGKDIISDNSETGKLVFIYDQKNENNEIASGKNTRLKISGKSWINDYEPNIYKYGSKSISPNVDYNADDGIYIGGGYKIKGFGFRKEPASFIHSLSGSFAPKTAAYIIKYRGDFYSVLGRNTDILLSAAYNGPQNTFSYYGEGNSTQNIDNDRIYYRVRTNNLSLSTFVQRRFTKAFRIGMGPGYEYYNVENTKERFVNSTNFPEKAEIAAPSKFGTLKFFTDIDFVDDNIFPTSGVRWNNQVNYFNEFESTKYKFLQLKSDISFYATPNFNFPMTAAFRFGGATNIGDYKFFQANSLGSNTSLRGFRNNRFSGKSILYQNTELRLPITNIRNYYLTGNLGAFAFFDSGRVFSNLPERNIWHIGYGPGVWLKLYNLFLISSAYGISKEGKYISLKTGMTF